MVAAATSYGLKVGGDLDLSHAFGDERSRFAYDQLGHLAAAPQGLELVWGLHRASRAHDARAVDQIGSGEEGLVATKKVDRHHIELEGEAPLRIDTLARYGRRQLAQAGQRLDPVQIRLLSSPVDIPAHQVHRLTGGGHQQVPLLDGTGEVEEIDVLDEDARSHTVFAQPLLDSREPLPQLL
ncbi:MAG: hypothetical protein M5U22_12170 [Thermoleophilia bacterium]|nr:hypothetical protein [Thermoleophilia bacterium]